MKLAEVVDGRDNNFNALRLFAALLVVFGHSWSLTASGTDPLNRLTGYAAGSVGLAVFFTISGYLITRSALERTPGRFLYLRCLRIVPALLVVSMFETFVVGPIFFEGTAAEYFASRHSWGHLKSASMFYGDFYIKGVFPDNPLKGLNGSTWTLPVEMTLYVAALLAATFGLLRPRAMPVLLALCVGLYAYARAAGLSFPDNVGPYVVNKVALYPLALWGLFFCLGSSMWVYRDLLELSGGIACCAILLLIVARSIWDAAFVGCFAYLTIYFALAVRPLNLVGRRLGDISYGVYVFAWPIQQWAVATTPACSNPWILAAVSIPISILFGLLSWNLVEKPAMKLRHLFAGGDPRPSTPPVEVVRPLPHAA
jgi:peptidoglycan/LPS O-acetylase OafA/YrhL